MCGWATRAPGPAGSSQREKRAKRKVGEADWRTATPAAKPGHLRTLRVIEKKRGRDGVPTVTACAPNGPSKQGGRETSAPDRGRATSAGTGPLNSARGVRAPRRNREVEGRHVTSAPAHAPKPPPPPCQGRRGDRLLTGGAHRSRHTTDRARGVPAKRQDHPTPKETPNPAPTPQRRQKRAG